MSLSLGTVTGAKSGASAASLTQAHTAVAGQDLLVFAALYSTPGTTTAVYGGVTVPSLGYRLTATWTFHSFYLPAPSAGSANMVLTPPGNTWMVMGIYNVAFTGAGAAMRAMGIANGAFGTAPSASVTSATGDLVIDLVTADNTNLTYAPGGSQVEVFDNGTGNTTSGASSSLAGGSGTTSMSQTISTGSTYGYCVLSLREITGASGGGASAYTFA